MAILVYAAVGAACGVASVVIGWTLAKRQSEYR